MHCFFSLNIIMVFYFIFFEDLMDILHKSYDVNELKHIWIKWREATGKKVRPMYKEYVKLSNEAARLNSE